MIDATFKKLAAQAKDAATLDQLKYYRHKTAARLVLAEKWGQFPVSFVDEIKDSLKEYDLRIQAREQKLARSAKLAMLKTAAVVLAQ